MADLMTVTELRGSLRGRRLLFIGDGNNVARSLAVGCGKLGVNFVLACPPGYGFDEKFKSDYATKVRPDFPKEVHDPFVAVRGADVIYTDVWTSMGQEAEREERLRRFAKFQVNDTLLAAAPPTCKVLHCLPAHRGEEITDAVMDGPRCLAFDLGMDPANIEKLRQQGVI